MAQELARELGKKLGKTLVARGWQVQVLEVF